MIDLYREQERARLIAALNDQAYWSTVLDNPVFWRSTKKQKQLPLPPKTGMPGAREKYIRENVGPSSDDGCWAPYHRTEEEAAARFDSYVEFTLNQIMEQPARDEKERARKMACR